jgi:hypothetical protein
MDQQALLWILGIVVTGVIGIAVGLFVHVKEDGKHHERIATLEERTGQQQQEIRGLRDMRHEIMEQCTRSISEFYTDSVKRIAELREWVVERMK